MSSVCKSHSPFSRQAAPISDTPSGPGKASGNMVRTVAVKGMGSLLALLPSGEKVSCVSMTDEGAGG